ncbi:unnamed protein product [Camellia sinensis]
MKNQLELGFYVYSIISFQKYSQESLKNTSTVRLKGSIEGAPDCFSPSKVRLKSKQMNKEDK